MQLTTLHASRYMVNAGASRAESFFLLDNIATNASLSPSLVDARLMWPEKNATLCQNRHHICTRFEDHSGPTTGRQLGGAWEEDDSCCCGCCRLSLCACTTPKSRQHTTYP